MTTANLLPVIHALFDAVTDSEKWSTYLQCLASCFKAKGSQIVRVQPHDKTLAFSALYGFDDAVLRLYGGPGGRDGAFARYAEHFVRLMPSDPRIRLLERYPGRPLSCRLLLREEDLRGSDAYRQLLDPADVEYSLVVNLVEDDASAIMMGVFRGKASTHFTEPEVESFGQLVPFVRQAIRISEHLARVDTQKSRALQALDTVPMGILLARQDGRVVQTNATAREALSLRDGLTMQGDRIRLDNKEEERFLHDAIRRAVDRAVHGGANSSDALAVSRPSGKDAYSVVVTTLWGNHLKFGLSRLDEPLAVIFLTIPERSPEAPAELLQRLFGLTSAQARIVELLVSGATLEETAGRLQISTETARVHLKKVFENVGVHKQSELIAKVLATPVWMSRPREQSARSNVTRQ